MRIWSLKIVCVLLMLMTLISFFPSSVLADQSPYNVSPGPVILLHGFSGQSQVDCSGYWSTATKYLSGEFGSHPIGGGNFTQWQAGTKTIGYYSNDYNCDVMLPSQSDAVQHCANYEYTAVTAVYYTNTNTSIRHLACLLAWYLYDTYTSHGTGIEVVAHSMGGLLIWYALYATQNNFSAFPPSLSVRDVVTFATPFEGLNLAYASAPYYGCTDCLEGQEMSYGGDLITEIAQTGNTAPQGKNGTDWTVIGSTSRDDFITMYSATGLVGNVHPVVYISPGYAHVSYPNLGWLGYLEDSLDSADATVYLCNPNVYPVVWSSVSRYPHALLEMLNAILSPNW